MRQLLIGALIFFINLAVSASEAAHRVEINVIVTPEELDLSETPIGVVPGAGIFALFDNALVSIEPDSAMRKVEIAIPDSVAIDDFIFVGNKLVLKKEESLIWTSSTSGFDAVTLEDSDYSIQAATDSTIFVCTPDMVLELNLKSKKPEIAVRPGSRAVEVRKLHDGLLMAAGNSILSLYNGEWTILHTHPGPINVAAFMPEGIFIGTDDGLWRIIGDGVVELLAPGTVKKLYNDKSVLYILDGADNLLSLRFNKT